MSDGLRPTNQPTKINTNNNTRPVIQLYANKTQPIFASASLHCGASGYRDGQTAMVQKSWVRVPLQVQHFFLEKISNPPKHNWFSYQGWPMATQNLGPFLKMFLLLFHCCNVCCCYFQLQCLKLPPLFFIRIQKLLGVLLID